MVECWVMSATLEKMSQPMITNTNAATQNTRPTARKLAFCTLMNVTSSYTPMPAMDVTPTLYTASRFPSREMLLWVTVRFTLT
jgi:hypothetical protein